MTPNPILKVLFTLKKYRVKSLLIGGQACIIYGAAEFSRDSDFIILASADNLKCLQRALRTIRAELIYVPPLELRYLERGHACHFRCRAKDVRGLRVDVISKLRGCEPFDKLWKRRETIVLKNGNRIDIIGLRDLAQSKKTQRDKDWLMLKRLVENDIILHKDNPNSHQISWWFCEGRNPERLIELAVRYPQIVRKCMVKRPLLLQAVNRDMQKLNVELQQEELAERAKDIEYWAPLRKELEMLRHKLKRW